MPQLFLLSMISSFFLASSQFVLLLSVLYFPTYLFRIDFPLVPARNGQANILQKEILQY